MNFFLLRYFLIFLFILTSSSALDDENGNLNLQEPRKLNKIEGKITPLDSVKKTFTNNIPSLKTKKLDSYESDIDTSKYVKVKLIDTVLETLSHSDLLKSSREKVIQYEIKVKNALSNYYPTIDFEYNLGRTRSFPGTDDTGKFKFYNDKNYKFVLRQNIYSGGATNYDVKSVAKKLEVAKNQYRITLDSEIKKSIKAYFGVVFANRSVMVNERNMKKLNKVLEIVAIKYDNGAASIGDFTSIKASVANAMTKIVKVKSKFIESLRYYEYIAGIDFEKTLPYEKNFNVSISSFDDLFERSLEKNRNLVNYYRSIEAEKFKQKKLESSFKPKLDFELSYKKTMDEEDFEEESREINGKFKLSYNIFNGGRDKNKVLESSSSIRDLKYRLEEEKRKLKWNLSKIHTSVESVREALKSTITEVKASRQMVSAYWDAFKLGEQDLQVLLQGQKQLNSAETELVKYEKNHTTDFFNILEITGDLSAFFDVDPEDTKFIDFSKSDYKKNIFVKDGTKITLDSKKEEAIELEKDILKEEEIEKKEMEIPLPKPSIDENIDNFLKDFLSFDDESFMIEISSFGNIYESFDFIKANNFDTNSFSYDVVEKYNIKTKVAHNNFKTEKDAKEYLKLLEIKDLNKTLNIRKVKDIKSLYNKYIDGLKIKVKKVKQKIKIVEKIRQEKKKKELLTNEVFKKEFLNSNDNYFTINVSSFTKNEKVEEFIKLNDIYDQSFFFKYGDNKQLIKLVYGIYSNYSSLEQELNKFILESNNIFPVVEKVGLVKKLYNENIELNVKKDEPIEYEYINLSKKEQEEKKITKLKKDVIKSKKNDEILTLTKRPTLDDINKKEKEKIQEIKKKLERILPTKKVQEEKAAKLVKELEVKKLAEEKILAEEKARLLKEEARKAQELKTKKLLEEKAKLAKELEAKKISENKRIKEEKLAQEKIVAEEKRKEEARKVQELKTKKLLEEKSKLEREQEAKRIADVKAKLAIEQEAKRIKEKKLAEEKILAEEKARLLKEEARKAQELKTKKLLEEKAKLAKELEAKKIAKAKRIKEEKLAQEKKLFEEARKIKELEAKRIADEKAKLAIEQEAKKLNETKRIKEKKLTEEKKLFEEEVRLSKEKANKLSEVKRKEDLRLKEEAKKTQELKTKKLLDEKAKLAREQEAKKLDETKRIKEKKLAEEKILVEEKARLLKEEARKAQELKTKKLLEEKAKLAKELEAKKIAEAKRIKEEKLAQEKIVAEEKRKEEARKVQELKTKKLLEEKSKLEREQEAKRIADVKAKIEREQEFKRIANEKVKLAKELEAKKIAENKRIKEEKLAQEKIVAEEKARLLKENADKLKAKRKEEAKKIQELKTKKLLEEKAKLEREQKAKRIADEKAKLTKELEAKKLSKAKNIKEEKARLLKEKANKLAEAKRKEELRLKEEARKVKELEGRRIASEKVKLARELEAKKIAEAKIRKEKKLAEEKKLVKDNANKLNLFNKSKIEKEKEKILSKTNNLILTNKPIEEIDFANGLKEVEKVPEIPYAQRLKDFKDQFNKASKNKYTLKLITIDSNKIQWYAHRFGLDPNYLTVKRGSKTDIYYGIFDSIGEARDKTSTLHPKIYEANPPVKRIGAIR